MELKDKAIRVGFWSVCVLLVALIIFGAVTRSSYESRVSELQNKLAVSTQTVEEQRNTYVRLSQTSDDLTKLLNSKDEQLNELKKTIKKGNEDLLSVNTLVVKWKQAYEATIKGVQTEIPIGLTEVPTVVGECPKTRKKVEFEKDWGFLAIRGSTLTDPPEAYVKVWQPRPLGITIAVSQLSDGTWKARATSTEDSFSIDIGLSAVNPRILEPKWYENIGFSADIGAGSGFLAGLGVSYRIGNFHVGPKVWLSATGKLDTYIGAGATWLPFAR